jgi:hypothetical protein
MGWWVANSSGFALNLNRLIDRGDGFDYLIPLLEGSTRRFSTFDFQPSGFSNVVLMHRVAPL